MSLEKAYNAPRARNSDPETSHEAAAKIRPRITRTIDSVYQALKRRRNITSRELAQAAGLDRYEVARRLVDLERAGLAERGPKRRCTVQGWAAITWNPTENSHGQ